MKPCPPDVVAAIPEGNYTVLLKYANGETRRYDVKPLLDFGPFRELRDNPALFNRVRPWLGTVQWPNEADICPDALYEESVAV
ncbi:MAG: DUF2442 domain-containing protein [Verrucomicrobiales bacterium]|jgi:hypothetical protein|nr:DUF2442 domain-containing protein [Verrucomicrobiales bacterium]